MKKLIAFVLCLLAVVALSAGVMADEPETVTVTVPLNPGADRNPLEEYASQVFCDGLVDKAAILDGVEKIAYDQLLAQLTDLVNGNSADNSTLFTVLADYLGDHPWSVTKEEMPDPEHLRSFLAEQFDFDYFNVALALYLNHPELCFWATEEAMLSISYRSSGTSNVWNVGEICIGFTVGADYADETLLEIDLAALKKGSDAFAIVDQAHAAAAEIILAGENMDTRSRLRYYADCICERNTYNDEAAASPSAKNPYNFGAWKYIYVFDGDPTTNVVCEGYSKAFKYLCDNSFSPLELEVICVSGLLLPDGPHMWNVVNMADGNNYLVDVTNMDNDAEGSTYRNWLFMAQTEPDSNGYMVFSDGEDDSLGYEYDIHTLNLYAPEDLDISPKQVYDTVVLPEELEEIRSYAFADIKAQLIIVPENVREIGACAFANCKNLLFIRFEGSPVSIAADALNGCPNVTVIAPAGSSVCVWAQNHGFPVEIR